MPLHLLAQVPRQTQLWVASQQYSRQDSNDSRYGGVEIVNRVFSENNKNVDYLPEGSYTITKSMNRAWNNAYGKTHQYFPIVSIKDYRKAFMNTAINHYFNSSYKNLVSYFAEEEKISAEELREILALIEKKK